MSSDKIKQKREAIRIEMVEGPEMSEAEIDGLASLLFSIWKREYEIRRSFDNENSGRNGNAR